MERKRLGKLLNYTFTQSRPDFSRAPAAQRATKRSNRTKYMYSRNSIFMVNIASSMDRGHVPYDDDVMQHGNNTPAISSLGLQCTCTSMIFDIHFMVIETVKTGCLLTTNK